MNYELKNTNTIQKLWEDIYLKKIAKTHPFDRDFIWLKKEDFEKFKIYFTEDYNPLHKGKSYRSNNYFKHLHAVEQGHFIFIHFDHGNYKKFFLLLLIHFFIDVIPYFIFCLVKRKKIGYFYTYLEHFKQIK